MTRAAHAREARANAKRVSWSSMVEKISSSSSSGNLISEGTFASLFGGDCDI